MVHQQQQSLRCKLLSQIQLLLRRIARTQYVVTPYWPPVMHLPGPEGRLTLTQGTEEENLREVNLAYTFEGLYGPGPRSMPDLLHSWHALVRRVVTRRDALHVHLSAALC